MMRITRPYIFITAIAILAGLIFKLKFQPSNEGWLIVDLSAGTTLSQADKLVLHHPEVFGVILPQAKSYGNPAQGGIPYANTIEVKNLVHQIKSIRPDLLICIDHEGGRVVRFQEEDPSLIYQKP